MKITEINKDQIKEIFEQYWIYNTWDISDVSFDDLQLLTEILNKFPNIEYNDEWNEMDILWDIHHQIDSIEIDKMFLNDENVIFKIN